jgi:transposase
MPAAATATEAAPCTRAKLFRGLTCDASGTGHHRDVNAARNIFRLGLETLLGGVTIRSSAIVTFDDRSAQLRQHS